MQGKKLNLVGKRFGIWTVIKRDGTSRGKKSTWLCQCDCGTIRSVLGVGLKSGHSNSCGCKRGKEPSPNAKKRQLEHPSWSHMMSRCYRTKDLRYKDYGGRGITVCERWINSFENFVADMGKRPSKEYSLDRIDVNGNYEPSNCRWATQLEQRHNRRDSK